MHKQDQRGFTFVIAIVLLVVVFIIGFAGYRVFRGQSDVANGDYPGKSKSQSQKSQPVAAGEPQLVLSNIGMVSLDGVVVTSDALREYSSKGLKGFYIFGDKLGGKDDVRLNPNFEFSSLKAETKIVSAIDGIVAFIKEQPDSKDFEVFVQPKDKSAWTIGYDHIVNVAVKKDDKVKVGDFLGNPAPQNNGAYRFEFQVNKDENGQSTHYCPSTLLADSVKSTILSDLTKTQEQWNQLAGQKLYDLSAQTTAGCLKPTMSAAEAEGR